MSMLKEKMRLPDEMLRGRASSAKPRRPRKQGRRGPNPFRQGLLLGICVGMTAALLVGVVAFLTTRPTVVTPAAQPSEAAAKAPGGKQDPQAAISINAEHLGNLQVRIEAKVSAPGSYNPITKGQVVAYIDMVAMPLAHKKGPIVMAEVSGTPGVYQAVANADMVGEYNITVEVKQPMAASANQRLEIGTVQK
ncbi:MAG: hypothetical protein ABW000_12905 [Actinoplanes sp.]